MGHRAHQTPVKTAVGAGGEGTFSVSLTFGPKLPLLTPVLLASGLLHQVAHDLRQLLYMTGHSIVDCPE